jgi:hypothetical protein
MSRGVFAPKNARKAFERVKSAKFGHGVTTMIALHNGRGWPRAGPGTCLAAARVVAAQAKRKRLTNAKMLAQDAEKALVFV